MAGAGGFSTGVSSTKKNPSPPPPKTINFSLTEDPKPMWQRVSGVAGGVISAASAAVDAVTRTGATASAAAAAEAADAAAADSRTSVRLLLDYPPDASVADTLRAQEGCCACCGDPLNGFGSGTLVSKGTALLRSAVGAGFRRCEYSGSLCCPRCQPADAVAVLPAAVAHDWDFSNRKVSAAAASYLESIRNQPMLCLGAVNPGVYTRVPLLANVRSRRYKLSKLVPDLRGFEEGRALLRSAGARAYLLEGGEYYAMRDLMDLSKGAAFARLPRWLEDVEKKAEALIKGHVLKRQLAAAAGGGSGSGSGGGGGGGGGGSSS